MVIRGGAKHKFGLVIRELFFFLKCAIRKNRHIMWREMLARVLLEISVGTTARQSVNNKSR